MTIHRFTTIVERIDDIARMRAAAAWKRVLHERHDEAQARWAERDTYERARRELRMEHSLPVTD